MVIYKYSKTQGGLLYILNPISKNIGRLYLSSYEELDNRWFIDECIKDGFIL